MPCCSPRARDRAACFPFRARHRAAHHLGRRHSLDYLLYPNVPVVIPDAVFYKATRDSARLGAQSIIDWVRTHRPQIEIAVTNAYLNFDAARSVDPKAREPHFGERAAVEVIEEPARLQGDAEALPLCEETAVIRRVIVCDRDRIIELSTMDFLKIHETERRIQSADAVFDRALAAGRTPSRAERFGDHDPALREAVRDTLRPARRDRSPDDDER